MPLFPTLLTLLYFAAGSMFGYVIRECFKGQASSLLDEPIPFFYGIIATLIGLPYLYRLWRRRDRDTAPKPVEDKPPSLSAAFAGPRITNRVLFLAGTLAWTGGLILGLLVDAKIE